MSRQPAFVGIRATFPGVLRCVEPADYWLWLGRKDTPPERIAGPLQQFCADAETAWCREQRAAKNA